MGEQELLPGVQVDIRSVVRDYCETDRLAYMYFDSIDAGTDPQDIEPSDIWIANNLNGRIQLGAFAAIWGRVEEHRDVIRSALGRIPVEAALWDVDDEMLRDAGSLLDMLCGPRASGARITKILHKKRPDLFPIIDSRVRPLFEDVVPSVDGRSWAEYLVEFGKPVGPWIKRNAEVLDEARSDFSQVTRLRAYDICLWKYATSRS